MPNNLEIARRLRELRNNKGLTQEAVARDIKVSVSAITNYELGVRIPRDEIKIKLADYYSTTVDSIFFK